MSKSYSFCQQYKIGELGVEWFLERYKKYHRNDVENKKDVDLINDDGELLELKTDTYVSTPNFFMEVIGNEDKGTSGGVFKAKKEKAKYFGYLFIKQDKLYVMETEKAYERLVEVLRDNDYRRIRVNNRTYFTIGFCVPMYHFEDLFIDKF